MRIFPRLDRPFKIIEEPAVTLALTAATQKWPRVMDAWEGLTWIIARGADGPSVTRKIFGGKEHYMLTYKGDPAAGFPRMTVVYRWGNGSYTVRLLLIDNPR